MARDPTALTPTIQEVGDGRNVPPLRERAARSFPGAVSAANWEYYGLRKPGFHAHGAGRPPVFLPGPPALPAPQKTRYGIAAGASRSCINSSSTLTSVNDAPAISSDVQYSPT